MNLNTLSKYYERLERNFAKQTKDLEISDAKLLIVWNKYDKLKKSNVHLDNKVYEFQLKNLKLEKENRKLKKPSQNLNEKEELLKTEIEDLKSTLNSALFMVDSLAGKNILLSNSLEDHKVLLRDVQEISLKFIKIENTE